MTTVFEHPEARREVLTSSGETMPRLDAEALGYAISPYADLVEQSARIAVRHPEHTDLVSLPPFGLVTTERAAKAMGFAVSQVSAAPPTAPSNDPKSAWRSAIFTSPEARERPSATAELVSTQSPETLSADAARALLRGLPIESEDTTKENMTTTTEDPKAARLAEISNNMAIINGRKAPQQSMSDVDPAKLKRLAEIEMSMSTFNTRRGYGGSASQPALKQLTENRINELAASGQGNSAEAKNLRHALSTNETTAAPLSRVLAQLGADTTKLLPTI